MPTIVPDGYSTDGGMLLRAHAERLDGMARMLAGLEWPFVIRRPDELRTALHEHVQWLVTAYGRPSHWAAPSARAVNRWGSMMGRPFQP
jgi:hypothetical protein